MRYTTLWLLVAGCSLASCTTLSKPVGFWSHNRYNARLERQGPWRIYFDSAEHHLAAKGRFRRNYERGRWRYFSYSGQREKWERYHRRPAGLVTIRHYNAQGKLYRRGQARYVNEPDGPHFYWFGPWYVYNAQGRLSEIELYEAGHRVSVQPVKNR